MVWGTDTHELLSELISLSVGCYLFPTHSTPLWMSRYITVCHIVFPYLRKTSTNTSITNLTYFRNMHQQEVASPQRPITIIPQNK